MLRHFLGLAIAIAGLTQAAQALPSLRIFDGTTTITITDNAAGDSSGVAGRVVWDGTIGNWTLNTHVGTGYPVLGSLSNPVLDLSFNAVSNGAGGTLTISFSVDGFGPTSGSATAMIGGTAGGTVMYRTGGGTNNTLFNMSNILTTQGPFTSAFSGSATGGAINNVGPYSLTQQIQITHTGAGISTGNSLLTVPDSGTSVLLLGTGLMGLACMARLRKRLA